MRAFVLTHWRATAILNMRHDRVSRDHFRREPYPSRRDPQGGSLRRGRGRTWTWGHAACRHVRACRLIKGSDGSSLATLRRRRVGRMWRRDVRLPSDSKSPRPVSRRGLNSCDIELMPVICPTCQIFLRDSRQRFLFKSLDRRCGLIAGNRFEKQTGACPDQLRGRALPDWASADAVSAPEPTTVASGRRCKIRTVRRPSAAALVAADSRGPCPRGQRSSRRGRPRSLDYRGERPAQAARLCQIQMLANYCRPPCPGIASALR